MSAQIIDGKAVAQDAIAKVKAGAEALAEAHGIVPGLAVVLVGEDPASQVYVASKGRMAKECGFHSVQHTLPADTTQDDLLALIASLNADPAVHGILVQLPLPAGLDERTTIAAIDPAKDVDGLHDISIGRLASGQMDKTLVPCTPKGCMVLLESVYPDGISGLDAVVVGRSNLVGRPVAALLQHANATVTIAHSRTRELPELCRRADVLVAAIGRPEFIKGEWIKPGATVIDVGINRIPAPERGEGKTRLVGDVEFASAAERAAAITPVPGGVGPMTIAMLMANTLNAAERSVG
ncbi:bifunctional methylenetetrahydrofolate dehydrogenase/methenyltetrahydrofolate cyclohydrolase FolD [Pelagibacterium xiamenense]|uniref:bifunctional methylenetetrahydrofolate dehydrogenase/methenyltetrahydrofolate cyclohydrolase FolD n=1 Tax=Pelagibacterium xiamenense TaxID=2901140 RepID=UPI001E3118FD|nr:bifunctional methylenetetrahydrofolate dehydrogenase/methenyltetrahydrofolate cyclohydrolase FolD [Pelagibacterium xiamenense]MCD7060200.1 bifunctional methylenetetrahydrofolate dehydrogenase/methenyltetrahydrofolate cyclohydrolase FolD [Pelagibacterium xiamenense]